MSTTSKSKTSKPKKSYTAGIIQTHPTHGSEVRPLSTKIRTAFPSVKRTQTRKVNTPSGSSKRGDEPGSLASSGGGESVSEDFLRRYQFLEEAKIPLEEEITETLLLVTREEGGERLGELVDMERKPVEPPKEEGKQDITAIAMKMNTTTRHDKARKNFWERGRLKREEKKRLKKLKKEVEKKKPKKTKKQEGSLPASHLDSPSTVASVPTPLSASGHFMPSTQQPTTPMTTTSTNPTSTPTGTTPTSTTTPTTATTTTTSQQPPLQPPLQSLPHVKKTEEKKRKRLSWKKKTEISTSTSKDKSLINRESRSSSSSSYNKQGSSRAACSESPTGSRENHSIAFSSPDISEIGKSKKSMHPISILGKLDYTEFSDGNAYLLGGSGRSRLSDSVNEVLTGGTGGDMEKRTSEGHSKAKSPSKSPRPLSMTINEHKDIVDDLSSSQQEKLKKSKSLSNVLFPEEEDSTSEAIESGMKTIIIRLCSENRISVPPRLDEIVECLKKEKIFTVDDLSKVLSKRNDSTRDVEGMIPPELASLFRIPNQPVVRKSNSKKHRLPKSKHSQQDLKHKHSRTASDSNSKAAKSTAPKISLIKERDGVLLQQQQECSWMDSNESVKNSEEVSDSDDEEDGDDANLQPLPAKRISFLAPPQPGRVSTLAQLAAGLSLAGLELSEEDNDSEDDDDDDSLEDPSQPPLYPMEEELLDDAGLSLPEPEKWNIKTGDVVSITARLGKGATAVVWSGIISNKLVAVKRIELAKFAEGVKYAEIALRREYHIVRSLNHKNIVKYYGMFYNKESAQVNLVMELIDGVPLTDLVFFCGQLPESQAGYILSYLLQALHCLHQNQVMHRDLKPDNVLIDINATVKLIDFGTSTKFDSSSITRKRSTVGTPWYCAPEVINTEPYNFTCDVWSLGCLTIELVSGKPPFDDLKDIACLFKMAEGNPPPLPENISEDCRDFLVKCLMPSWEARPSMGDLLQHSLVVFDSTEEEKRRKELVCIINEMRDVKTKHIQKQRKKLTRMNQIQL